MTDYRSLEELWVLKEGVQVAGLRRVPKGCEFRYTDAYLDAGLPAIALHLPVNRDGIRVEGVTNLPTYFAGLLPEGVMYSAVRRLIRSAPDDLFAVLAATGSDAVGDVSVCVPGEGEREPTLDLEEAAGLVAELLEGDPSAGASYVAAIPGVQPKMSLGEIVRASRTVRYIAKFNSPDYPNLIQNEFAFMRLARLCRIEGADVRMQGSALVVRRFDRKYDAESGRMEKLHVEDMLQVSDQFPNSKYTMEYVDLLEEMYKLGVSKASILHALRLYVFSYLIGNGDLHAKNVSLVYDNRDSQWRLSPAYDLLSTLPYSDILPDADRMALALADESFGRFTMDEFVSVGLRFGLPGNATQSMVKRTANSVLKFGAATVSSVLSGGDLDTIKERARLLIA